jgi:hypothetical protein
MAPADETTSGRKVDSVQTSAASSRPSSPFARTALSMLAAQGRPEVGSRDAHAGVAPGGGVGSAVGVGDGVGAVVRLGVDVGLGVAVGVGVAVGDGGGGGAGEEGAVGDGVGVGPGAGVAGGAGSGAAGGGSAAGGWNGDQPRVGQRAQLGDLLLELGHQQRRHLGEDGGASLLLGLGRGELRGGLLLRSSASARACSAATSSRPTRASWALAACIRSSACSSSRSARSRVRRCPRRSAPPGELVLGVVEDGAAAVGLARHIGGVSAAAEGSGSASSSETSTANAADGRTTTAATATRKAVRRERVICPHPSSPFAPNGSTGYAAT